MQRVDYRGIKSRYYNIILTVQIKQEKKKEKLFQQEQVPVALVVAFFPVF